MSDEDKASKTEDPTQRKLDEARKKGDVAKSPDVPQFMALAAASGVLVAGGATFSRQLLEALTPFVAHPEAFTLHGAGGVRVYQIAAMAAAPVLLAVFAASSVAGAAGNLLQHGFLLTAEKIKPQWKKVSPVGGFKRIFGPDGLMEFAKTIAKLLIVAGVCWLVLKPHAQEMETLAGLHPAAMLALARDLFVGLIGGVLTALAAGAGLDFLWQKHRWMKRQKMSLHEVKEDYKQSEGDPHVKARQKQIRNERSRRRMITEVKTATVVVMNPTHYAVALRYEAGETPAPLCVAKGVDSLALKIREVAEANGVAIVEDAPLARALHKAVQVDQTIPREHYEAVAKIIGFVLNRGRPGAARTARG